MPPPSKEKLETLYLAEKKSVAEIAGILNCSQRKVDYWIQKYTIPKRSISDAVYLKNNPNGDPFVIRKLRTREEVFLHGVGLGLYWGEGTKTNKYTIRLGNTDPALVKKFIEFLESSYEINRSKLRFGLQVFSDMNPKKAARFWQNTLEVPASSFQKVVVTPARSIGTYRQKTKHGVLTVHYNNKKLRDILNSEIERLRLME